MVGTEAVAQRCSVKKMFSEISGTLTNKHRYDYLSFQIKNINFSISFSVIELQFYQFTSSASAESPVFSVSFKQL